MRFLFSPEVELMATQAGFAVIDAHEWMSGRAPGFDTWVCVLSVGHEANRHLSGAIQPVAACFNTAWLCWKRYLRCLASAMQ
jgi:hypothetical protein